MKTRGAGKSNTSEQGFSVLEALVAMAILAAALLPILDLQSQFVRTTESLERAESRLAIADIALSHIKALNLDQTPNGSISTPYGSIIWKSTVDAGPAKGRDAAGFPSRYIITLYTVDVSLTSNSGQIEHLSLHGLGWHPTISILDTL